MGGKQYPQERFHDKLKRLVNEYVLLTYSVTKKYPKDERYGLTSQDRRASLSVMLNYVEGYARMKNAVKQNFYETAFASLKESIYCKYIAFNQKYINEEEYKHLIKLKEEIGAMFFSTIEGIRKKRK